MSETFKSWVAKLGYVGTKSTHLRETRDAIQAYDVRNNPITITATNGTTYTITENTAANINARSRGLVWASVATSFLPTMPMPTTIPSRPS